MVDENISPRVVAALRRDDHDVLYVSERIKSFDDISILKIAAKEQRILITKDKDFGNLIFKRRIPYYIVVFLRLKNDSTENTLKVLKKLLKVDISDHGNAFIIADDATVRIVSKR